MRAGTPGGVHETDRARRRLGHDPARAETNIVIFDSLRVAPAELSARAKREGVLVSPFGGASVRAVTHLDVDRAGIARAADVLRASAR